MSANAKWADDYPDACSGRGNGGGHSAPRTPVMPQRLTVQWFVFLDRVIEELERLPSLTEQRFLNVGTKLRTLVDRLREMEESATAAGRLMSSEETLLAIHELEEILSRMEEYFHVADQVAIGAGSALNAILRELITIHRLMKTFKEQVGNLRMLKILTSIQSATHGGHGAGFQNVADDIGNLSEQVQAKSTAIIARIKSLHGDLEKAIRMTTALEENQKRLSHQVVTAIHHNISSFAGMHASCSDAARDVSGHSAEISRDVGEVVVSLQFQDITRQQMEHVSEALVTVRQSLGDGAGNAILPGEAAEVCSLQVAQLENSVDELMAAMTRITVSLQGVSRQAAEVAVNVHGLFRQADLVGHASLSDMESGLASVVTAFTENVTTNDRLADIVQGVARAMTEITAFAEDIDYLGSEIRLIALNAIVKAAQAGKDGAAFSVIAETVKRLSEEICLQAAAITASIRAIAEHVTELQHHLASGSEGEETVSDAELRKVELATAISRLKEITAAVTALLARTDEASESLADIVDGALFALDSSEIMATLRSDVISRLDKLVQTAGGGVRVVAGRSAGLGNVEQGYTMQSERKVHQLFAASLPAGEEAHSLHRSGSHGGADEAGFGDNVEFF